MNSVIVSARTVICCGQCKMSLLSDLPSTSGTCVQKISTFFRALLFPSVSLSLAIAPSVFKAPTRRFLGSDFLVPRCRHLCHLRLQSRWPFTGVLRGPAKVPQRVLLECFWPPGSECPTSALRSACRHSGSPETPQEHSSEHFSGTPIQVDKGTPKALFAET